MKVHEVCKPGFGLHQTFPPRFGWLKKAYDGAQENPAIFSDQDATVELGVGKNMVEAIAFWAVAFQILQIEPSKKKVSATYQTTKFGDLMFGDGGLDPYLELPQSLWLLHWKSLQEESRLPVWWLTFSSFSLTEFADDDLVDFVLEETSAGPWQYNKDKPVAKDVDCLLRMYSPRMSKSRVSLDDYLDSPFRDLGLIAPSSLTRGSYRFQIGAKPNLPDLMVLLTCLHYLVQHETSSATVPRLTTDTASPGKVFRLTESVITEALIRSAGKIEGIEVTSPAGVPQLTTDKPLIGLIKLVLKLLYPSVNKAVLDANIKTFEKNPRIQIEDSKVPKKSREAKTKILNESVQNVKA